MPRHTFVGLAILAVSEFGMLAHVEPFWTWHTPFAWTGYILFVDGVISTLRGSSWLTANRREFAFLALVSIPLWVVFEGYNLLIENWYYINLPENLVVRYFGYAWAFATISPGIFQTAELLATLRGSRLPTADSRRATADFRLSTFDYASIAMGSAMLLLPILWPSPYLAAPVFLGFVFLLDPINARAGDESLVRDLKRGSRDRLINLLVAGFICGGLWEFWNFWARTKWIYTVPILADLKIFEMPVLGYFGFPAFALECFTMYVFVRRLFWRRPRRAIGV
ncbi:MAG: hypothetical protein EHM55_10965 [Acidobacteria bacterium]|nr:MAG: hypothetical protein EHM55_10965 [Acidobacteriota bacterium]